VSSCFLRFDQHFNPEAEIDLQIKLVFMTNHNVRQAVNDP